MTTTPASGDRETEAAIRKRIAEEVRTEIDMYTLTHQLGEIRRSHVAGMIHALRIIERGTGVAEGEQG